METCTSTVQSRVPSSMNDMLMMPFLPEEVDQALSQMHPLKSIGPDGFGVCFYQKHWPTVGLEVRKSILDFLNSDCFYAGINVTYITLIPKLASASSMSEFRPSSLCNVIYKLIAKVLANRLKRVLPAFISPFQSAFVLGRLITDN